MQHIERLIVVYEWVDPHWYGSISIVKEEAANSEEVIQLEWSYPYVVSKKLKGEEIFYGSLPYLIGEVAKPIFRMNHRLHVLEKNLPEEIRSSMQVFCTDNALIHQMPASGFPASFLHQQEDLMKEALLLSGLHLRTLLEIFGKKRGTPVNLYDYDGNSNGTVSLKKLFDTLMHHRYCVISGEYIHDIFSRDTQLKSQRLFGSKISSAELFNAMISYISRIKVNDFIGMLCGRLKCLAVDSEPRDIMFAVQNVHSLAQLIGDRITDGRFREVQDFLFRQLTADEVRKIDDSKGEAEVKLVRRFTKPTFKIDADLHAKRIEMSMDINGKTESFPFGQEELFGVLTRAYGDDPIMPLENLIERYDKIEI